MDHPQRSLISLGLRCDVAFQLRMHSGSNVSHFFDWLVTPVDGLINIIKSDFKVFNPDDLVLDCKTIPHSVVDARTKVVFFHQFPVFNGHVPPDFLLYYSSFAGKLAHLAERFRKYMATRPVTLVRRDITPDKAAELEAALEERFPNADFQMLYLIHGTDGFVTRRGHAVVADKPTSSVGDSVNWARILLEEKLVAQPYRLSGREILGVQDGSHNLDTQNRLSEPQLRTAISANPDNPMFTLELSAYLRGAGRQQDALGEVAEALKRNPSYQDLQAEQAVLRWKTRQADAETTANLLSQHPSARTDPTTVHDLAEALIAAGRFAEALERLVEATIRFPVLSKTYVLKARCLIQRRDFPGAERSISTAIKLSGKNFLAHHMLASVLVKLGRVDAAIAAGEQAVALGGGFSCLFQLAGLYRSQGRNDDALEIYRRTLPLSGAYESKVRSQIDALTNQADPARVEYTR